MGMNSRERFQAALGMEGPDRVPVFYQHLGGASHVLRAAGVTMHQGYRDADAFARICLASRELFGYDNVMAGWGDLLVEAQAHGSTWRFPERDFYPRIERYAVQSPADVDRIGPVDPLDDPFWSVPLRAAALLQERLGGEAAVVGSIDSPFFVASELRGFESMLMDLFTAPEAMVRIIDVTLESSKRYADHAARLGLDAVFIDDSTATGQLVPPEMAEAYDTAYLARLVGHMREKGLRAIVHNDAQAPYLDLQAAARPSCLHFNNDYVDLDETFGRLRGKLCVMAGINHQDLIFRRSPDEVEEAVRDTIARYGGGPGLIVAPGCEVPFKSPAENIVRVREACERHGRYRA